jgi:hypothetical protein
MTCGDVSVMPQALRLLMSLQMPATSITTSWMRQIIAASSTWSGKHLCRPSIYESAQPNRQEMGDAMVFCVRIIRTSVQFLLKINNNVLLFRFIDVGKQYKLGWHFYCFDQAMLIS